MKFVEPIEVTKELLPGTILWRNFHVDANEKITMQPVQFEQAEKGSYCARLLLDDGWSFEPIVFMPQEGKKRGIVLIIHELPPEDWNYLTLVRVNKKGSVVFAKKGGTSKAYEQWAKASFLSKSHNLNSKPEEKFAHYKEHNPLNIHPGLKRMFFSRSYVANEYGGHDTKMAVAEI